MPFGRPPLIERARHDFERAAVRCRWPGGEGFHADSQHDGSFGRVRHRKRGRIHFDRDRARRQESRQRRADGLGHRCAAGSGTEVPRRRRPCTRFARGPPVRVARSSR